MRAALAMIRSLRLGLHIAIPTAGIESEAAKPFSKGNPTFPFTQPRRVFWK
jgi:hypothetical protein